MKITKEELLSYTSKEFEALKGKTVLITLDNGKTEQITIDHFELACNAPHHVCRIIGEKAIRIEHIEEIEVK